MKAFSFKHMVHVLQKRALPQDKGMNYDGTGDRDNPIALCQQWV